MNAFRRGIRRFGRLLLSFGWILAGFAVAVSGSGLISFAPACSPTAGQEQEGPPLEIENIASSEREIDTPDHWRFAPAPRTVTMPLMACRTGNDTVAITWKDMRLQPAFAAPNFVDGSHGQRMALRGQKIEANVRIVSTAFEESIHWAIQKHGLPPLPQAPRGPDEQWALCLQALDGPLRGKDGWGHCALANWARQPYADCASTLFRLTGRVPELPRLVPGGAHLPNDVIYFVTGRAGEWLRLRQRRVTDLLRQQNSDGSYHLWGDRGVMVYGTVPVLGATNWTEPNWIGLPVQWCGLVYADALLLLAQHDRSLDWRHLARGILIAGEQMQHTGGSLIGCLPDSFELATQARRGPSINPCALVSLRLALDGQLAGLAVAVSAGHRVVAPYAVSLQDEKIRVRAPKGSRYQILIDGERVISVISKGDDILNLTGGAMP